MTHIQASTLRAIHTAIADTGVCPSYEELCAATGIRSKGRMHEVVASLIADGYVRRGLGMHRKRSLEIIRLPASMGGVCPTCGREPA